MWWMILLVVVFFLLEKIGFNNGKIMVKINIYFWENFGVGNICINVIKMVIIIVI